MEQVTIEEKQVPREKRNTVGIPPVELGPHDVPGGILVTVITDLVHTSPSNMDGRI
jgi:hypothetical protein